VIKRAIFVLTSPQAGEQFLRVLPDLRGMGLQDATILHLLSAQPGPAEPMADLASWVRHFEASIPKVELALKRGDAVKWIYNLAQVRDADIVVISGTEGENWDLERVTSPLRILGIPILYLPETPLEGSIGDLVLVAIKKPETFERAVTELAQWFGSAQLRAVRVAARGAGPRRTCSGVVLETIGTEGDVATTLMREVQACRATLLTILADEDSNEDSPHNGTPVVKPLVEATQLPILIWPAED
jgi:hypothetical protein